MTELPKTPESGLVRDLFALPKGQELLAEWRRKYSGKVFSTDPLRMARNVGVHEFLNDIERHLSDQPPTTPKRRT